MTANSVLAPISAFPVAGTLQMCSQLFVLPNVFSNKQPPLVSITSRAQICGWDFTTIDGILFFFFFAWSFSDWKDQTPRVQVLRVQQSKRKKKKNQLKSVFRGVFSQISTDSSQCREKRCDGRIKQCTAQSTFTCQSCWTLRGGAGKTAAAFCKLTALGQRSAKLLWNDI